MATPIWNFEENEAIETDKVDMKPYKPTGKFFADAQTLVSLFKVVSHPSLKEGAYRSKTDKLQEPEKEIQTLNFFKYRLDSNTLRITQLALNTQTAIQTLK